LRALEQFKRLLARRRFALTSQTSCFFERFFGLNAREIGRCGLSQFRDGEREVLHTATAFETTQRDTISTRRFSHNRNWCEIAVVTGAVCNNLIVWIDNRYINPLRDEIDSEILTGIQCDRVADRITSRDHIINSLIQRQGPSLLR